METLYLRFISNEKAIPSAFRITALIYRDNLYVFLVVGCVRLHPADLATPTATMFQRGRRQPLKKTPIEHTEVDVGKLEKE